MLKNIKRTIRIAKLRRIAARQWQELARKNTIKLELGSGKKHGANGWTCVDMYGADINYDLRRGLPLNDASVDVIYTSHFLEHIDYKNLLLFIDECRRVLKPGGLFSVCVPDIRPYIDAYINQQHFRPIDTLYQPAVVSTNSFLDQVNYVAYMDGQHRFMFDEQTLVNLLIKCHFNQVSLRQFDATIDMASRDEGSIYAQAFK
ncbi:class I SAM-dependent methyltransferase [Salinimonas sediminis]|uniref:Methyltransferase domain-containing protein n=1 Tax=Salinimonas sediminis TaxID=2303538 RepID=A0A346NJL7_9ALTE|nr:methyltransferase domain-containing protein [Salinimonas sediminis]AXR05724.1 methyltransferase domain-containing protein [Salinimonas sediminis]